MLPPASLKSFYDFSDTNIFKKLQVICLKDNAEFLCFQEMINALKLTEICSDFKLLDFCEEFYSHKK